MSITCTANHRSTHIIPVGIEKRNDKNEICLGIKIVKDAPHYLQVAPCIKYQIFVGTRRNFENLSRLGKMDILKRVPVIWKADLKEYLDTANPPHLKSDRIIPVGFILYSIHTLSNNGPTLAFTLSYWPRDYLPHKSASKLPYYIEAITTKNLKDRGVELTSTSGIPAALRINQLARVNLPARKEVKIDEWLKGMGRGIKMYAK